MVRLLKGIAVLLVLGALSSAAIADDGNNGDNNGDNNGNGRPSAHAPEMDPSSMGGALALVGGGAVMLLGRRRAPA
jgi:hypothetical protein